MRRFVRPLFCLLVLHNLDAGELRARGPWTTLQNCRYLTKRANDGDTFHVSVNGTEYILRLYFVDQPETAAKFRDRVQKQRHILGSALIKC